MSADPDLHGPSGLPPPPPPSPLQWRDLTLDPQGRHVRRGGAPLRLTQREFDLLRLLMQRPGEVLSREQLAAQMYRWGTGAESNTVEVHVHHLRAKLGAGSIQTVRGQGYRLPEQPGELGPKAKRRLGE